MGGRTFERKATTSFKKGGGHIFSGWAYITVNEQSCLTIPRPGVNRCDAFVLDPCFISVVAPVWVSFHILATTMAVAMQALLDYSSLLKL